MKLLALTSNQTSFQSVRFRSGLNVVIAHRTEGAVATDSRNGVGKSTLLQIIDFCLGGTIKEGDSLAKLKGTEWEFSLALAFGDQVLRVTRSVAVTGQVILEGAVGLLGGETVTGRLTVGPQTWTDWLGKASFGLESRAVRDAFSPTFRQLIAHFLRFRQSAYNDMFSPFSQQTSGERQVENAYLLGLDWRLAAELQINRERERTLGRMSAAQVSGLLGELETQRAQLDARIQRSTVMLREFRVLPEYQSMQTDANDWTRRMQIITNDMTIDARRINLYRDEVESVKSTLSPQDLQDMYQELEVLLPDALVASISDVLAFHDQVARNRHQYLATEIQRLVDVQEHRRSDLQRLESLRSNILSRLEGRGALEDFATLQQELGSMSGSLQVVEEQISELRELRRGKAALNLVKLELLQRIALDIDERRPLIAPTVTRFAEVFEYLYQEQASLIVEDSDTGYRFRSAYPRQGSHGYGNVSIFAYDLSVAERWESLGSGPGFLTHDSTVFEGVDERQVAGALALAYASAATFDYQYLAVLNSDMVSSTELERVALDLAESTILELQDADPTGGLLGVRI